MTCDPTTVPAPDEVDIPTLRNMYREERDRRLRPDGQEQYAAAFQETEAVDFSDPHMTRSSRRAVSDAVDVGQFAAERGQRAPLGLDEDDRVGHALWLSPGASTTTVESVADSTSDLKVLLSVSIGGKVS